MDSTQQQFIISIIKKTSNFQKKSGQIICNKKEQAHLCLDTLRKHYMSLKTLSSKHGRVLIKYDLNKEEYEGGEK